MWMLDIDSSDLNCPLLVDKHLLPNKWIQPPAQDAYEINGETFYLREEKSDKYCEFEVVKNIETLESSKKDGIDLPLSVQITRFGVIVNSTILLPLIHWHTIVSVEGDITWCSVCLDVIIEIDEHIKDEKHLENMDKHMPLNIFDLDIVRSVDNSYHCGLCNEIFPEDLINLHLNSDDHQKQKLFCLNKASDVLDGLNENNEQKNSHHFKYNNKMGDISLTASCSDQNTGFWSASTSDNVETLSCDSESVEGGDDGFYDLDYISNEPTNGVTYASIAATASKEIFITWFGTKYKIKYDAWNMVIPLKCNYYCMVCKNTGELAAKSEHCESADHIHKLQNCPPVANFKKYIIRKVDDKFYHCGNCNNLQLAHLISSHIGRVHSRVPKSIENRTEEFKIPTEKTKKPNRTRNKDSDSNNNGKSDAVNNTERESINNYGSRESINSHENNNENKDLINNNRNLDVDSYGSRESVNSVGITANKNKDSVNSIPKETIRNRGNQTPNNVFHLQSEIMVNHFGYMIKVSLLSYHVIQRFLSEETYYCHICNIYLNVKDVISHLWAENHVRLFNGIYFLPFFGIHLIRAPFCRMGEMISMAHCATCHQFMPNNNEIISQHILHPVHLSLLNIALGFILPPQMYQNQNNHGNLQNNLHSQNSATKNNILSLNKEPLQTRQINENVITKDSKTTEVTAQEAEVQKPEIRPPLATDTKPDVEKNLLAKEFIDNNNIYFDMEDLVYVKLKNNFIKISLASYHSLVCTGDGSRFCFICTLPYLNFKKHITSKSHMENMYKTKFIDKYEKNLIRQKFGLYHCSICNVLIYKKELQKHLTWSIHAKNDSLKNTKRQPDCKNIKLFKISLTKETAQDDIDTDFKMVLNYIFKSEETIENIPKKNKIVLYKEKKLKFTWDAWHGLVKIKNGYYCALCKTELKYYEVCSHVRSEHRAEVLEDSFVSEYSPALVRKVDDATVHCLTCNIELFNKAHILQEHIHSKKHLKCYEDVSTTVSITDEDDVFTLNM